MWVVRAKGLFWPYLWYENALVLEGKENGAGLPSLQP